MEVIVILVILILVVFTEAAVYHKYGLYGIEYRVYLSKNETYEGEELEIIEEVLNKKVLPVPWLKSEIATSCWLGFTGTTANNAAEMRFVPSIFALRPNQKCVRKWRVTCLKRGVFRLEDTSLVTCDIFGFITKAVKIKVDQSVTVLPSPLHSRVSGLSREAFFGSVVTRRFICEDMFFVSGTREYSGREPLRKIHPASTARANRLMVYNNEYSTQNTPLIAINLQRGDGVGGRGAPISPSDAETYIKLAALIIAECTANGFKAGLCANGENGNGESFMYCPADGVYSGVELLRGLAALNEKACYPDFCEMLEQIGVEGGYGGYTDVTVISAYVCERMIKAADKLRYKGINTVFFCSNPETTGGYAVLPIRR